MTKIFKSVVLPATVDQVWKKIRDFNALPDWHTAIAASEIENDEPSDQVGCVRCLRLKEGGEIREQLLTLSDVEHLCCYNVLESPFPFSDYIATLRLLPITDSDQTYAEWSATFNCKPEDEEFLTNFIGQGVFKKGFDSLKSIFA